VIRKLVSRGIAVCVLFFLVSVSRGQNVSPNYFFNALVHYSEMDCAAPAQETTIARRYHFILDGGCSKDMNSIKSINPDVIWAFYNSGTDNDVPGEEHTFVVGRAQANGVNKETNYLHYFEDTQVSLGGQTFVVPGWGGGSATAESLARVPVYWKGRNVVNFASPQARQYTKEYIVSKFKVKDPSTNHYFDCIFLDNSSDAVLYNIGGILSGGAIAEHPSHAQIATDAFYSWYGSNMKTFFGALRDTLRLGPQWAPDGKVKYLSANGSLNSAGLIDWAIDEYNLSPTRNWLVWIESAIQTNKNNWAQKTKIFYEARITTVVNGRQGQISYAQALLDNLTTHYLVRTDSSLLFQSGPYQVYAAGWDTLVWRGCMDYDIGDALGDYNPNFFSGVDGKGYSFRVLSRQYQGALILVRPRGDWNQDFDDATIANIPLGGSYRPLLPNGTLGASVTSIGMRNGQGAILIPSAGGNTPPATPTLASPADGATVTGLRPILSVSNSFDPDAIDNITYFFEVYSDAGLTNLVIGSPAINEGNNTTSWTVSIDLQDSTTYWWRCRAYDSQAFSAWMAAKSFTVMTIGGGINNPPSAPTAYLPANRDTVATSRPALTVTNSTDPDGDVLVYEFQVFYDSLLSNLVTSTGSVPQGVVYTSWTVDVDLQDSTVYWWRSRSYYVQAYSSWMSIRSFLVQSGAVGVDSTAPVLKGPKNREKIAPGQAKLKVYPDAKPGSIYFFELATDTTMAGAVASPGITPNPGDTLVEWTTSALSEGVYFWKSRVYRGNGYSDWSQVASFEVAAFSPYAYPNPYKPSEGATTITFADLPPNAHLKIATVSGDLVYQVKLGPSDIQFVWDVRNQDGKELASGVYLFSVSYPGGSTSGKLAVIK